MRYKPLATMALVAACLMTAASARAQPSLEIGTTLVNIGFDFGAVDSLTSIGAPSGAGFTTPSAYASFFMSERVALEPQARVFWATSGGHSTYFANIAGQVDYFLRGTTTS